MYLTILDYIKIDSIACGFQLLFSSFYLLPAFSHSLHCLASLLRPNSGRLKLNSFILSLYLNPRAMMRALSRRWKQEAQSRSEKNGLRLLLLILLDVQNRTSQRGNCSNMTITLSKRRWSSEGSLSAMLAQTKLLRGHVGRTNPSSPLGWPVTPPRSIWPFWQAYPHRGRGLDKGSESLRSLYFKTAKCSIFHFYDQQANFWWLFSHVACQQGKE